MALVGGVGQIHGLGHLSSRINWIQWRTEGGGVQTPPRNSEDIGGVLDRMSKKNPRLDFVF